MKVVEDAALNADDRYIRDTLVYLRKRTTDRTEQAELLSEMISENKRLQRAVDRPAGAA